MVKGRRVFGHVEGVRISHAWRTRRSNTCPYTVRTGSRRSSSVIEQHNARGGSPFICDGSSSTCGLGTALDTAPGTALDTAPGTALGATQGGPLLRCRQRCKQRCKQRESSHNNQYKKSVARRTAPISTNSLAAFANSTAFAMGLPSTARGADMVETATSALLARAGQPGECQKKTHTRGVGPGRPPPPLVSQSSRRYTGAHYFCMRARNRGCSFGHRGRARPG